MSECLWWPGSDARHLHGCLVALLVMLHCGERLHADDVVRDEATVTGVVTDEHEEPLAGVLVRVAVPATDMRKVYPGSGHRVVEGTTDEQGRYELVVPLGGERSLAVDAMKPGFGSASGPLMSGLDRRRTEIAPGETFTASFVLRPALYAAGTVVDERGQPLLGIQVHASIRDSTSSGWIGDTKTDERGHFEIFDFPLEPRRHQAALLFRHPRFLAASIDDLYALTPSERRSLNVTLGTGNSISGRVLDAAGNPVPEAMIIATFGDDYSARKGAITMNDGRFTLAGLPSKEALVQIQSLSQRQHLQTSLMLDRDLTDIEFQLEPIVLTEPPDSIDVLGLKLVTITPELRAAYFLDSDIRGALIVDPGHNSARLGIGELQEGDYFWLVGERPVRSIRYLVDELVAAATRREHDPGALVVYGLRRVDFEGTNTQYLQLTADDVKQLQAAAAALAKRPVPPSVLADAKNARGLLGVWPSDDAHGAIVNQVMEGSAADRAGIRTGDIITQVDDQAIENGAQLMQVIRSKKLDDTIAIKIIRGSPPDQKKLQVVATLDGF